MGLRGGGSACKFYYFYVIANRKKGQGLLCVFLLIWGFFVFFHFSFMLGKAQGPRNYQNKAYEARIRSLPN
jgi:hypothetical protein